MAAGLLPITVIKREPATSLFVTGEGSGLSRIWMTA